MPEGREWVLFLIATVWAGDVSAFLTGSSLGRHKLYPKISPNKTFEGLVGAMGDPRSWHWHLPDCLFPG